MHALVYGHRWRTSATLHAPAINCLSDLPNLEFHYYARRVGEALIRLNSERDISGRTARARWVNLKWAAGKVKTQRTNRLSKILTDARTVLSCDIGGVERRDWNFSGLRRDLASKFRSGEQVCGFTDGSTSASLEKGYSGAGIVLSSGKEVIWAGGFRVLSRGNNYIAEYAAACVAIALVPPNCPLRLIEDNQGAVASQLSNPSERKRIRSSARAWRNTFGLIMESRTAGTKIEHVRSHTGGNSFEELGNQAADRVAKWALSNTSLPILEPPAEETFVLFLNDVQVTGDPIHALRTHCCDLSLKSWQTLKTQGRLAREDGEGVLKQASIARSLASDYNCGDVWVFYVHLVCDWLPVGYRLKKWTQDVAANCELCLEAPVEMGTHFLYCPALRPAWSELRSTMCSFLGEVLKHFRDPREAFIDRTVSYVRGFIKVGDISDEKLRELVLAFATTNYNREGLSMRKCGEQIWRILEARKCRCKNYSPHTCGLRNCWQTPLDFAKIVREVFTLNCEGMADALHRNPLFPRWCSEFQGDCHFGADHDFFQTPLEGNNVFINPPFNNSEGDLHVISRVIKHCIKLTQSSKPTRVVMVVPVFNGQNGERFLEELLASKRASVLAFFQPRDFFFTPPDAYYLRDNKILRFPHAMSLILLCSRSSLVSDPVDWQLWERSLRGWAEKYRCGVQLPANPLIYFLQPKVTARSVSVPTTASELIRLMPSLEGRTVKYPLSLTNSGLRRGLEELRCLGGLRLAAGIFPKSTLSMFPSEVREKTALSWRRSALWCSFKTWNLRKSLLQKRRKELNRTFTGLEKICDSPYHYLQSVNDNPWKCSCPRKRPFCQRVSLDNAPLYSKLTHKRKLKTFAESKKRFKTQFSSEKLVKPRRSERLRQMAKGANQWDMVFNAKRKKKKA